MKNKYYKKIYKEEEKKEQTKKIARYLIIKLIIGLLLMVFISLGIFVYYAKDLPRPEKFTEKDFSEPTKIYDRTGEVVLYTIYGEEKRDIISLDKMPKYLLEAVIATEDSNFYSHFGIDFKGIIRAFFENIKKGSKAQGGSTISQQLIRSSLLSGEKTIGRKIREIILTVELERRYPKEKILEFYLNQIPLGNNTYGVESASQAYFNKSVSEINIQESAILASLIRSPSRLSPYGPNKEDLMIRKDYVLDRMVIEKYISIEDAETTKKEDINFSLTSKLFKAPHFTLEVINYLNENYGENYLKTRGLKVYTTLDWRLQSEAEKIIKESYQTNRLYNAHNASLVSLNPKNGDILTMVGSVDYFKDSYPENCIPGKNCMFEPYPNVSMRERQPGSAFKPFVYATAFKKGYNDQTIIVDEPINIGGYSPKNYDGLFRGPITIREALAQSLNVPAVKTLAYLTNIEDSLKTAKDLGIDTLNRSPSFYGLPLVLGGGEVKLLEITSAYGVFASEGYAISPNFILKITDSQGRIIEQKEKTPRRVLNSSITKIITDILSDNNARGPMMGYNSPLNIPGVSVKTGTTQNFKDAWTIGYNKSIVSGVWIGNNDNTPMRLGESLTVAAPVWRRFMDYALIYYK
jgi:1A family penicillin-binding protein